MQILLNFRGNLLEIIPADLLDTLECEKLKTVGLTSMAKCEALTGSAVKGLTSVILD